jgi:hypothetical protein
MYLATVMLLGSGELGREFAIAAKRLGCRVIACHRYANAPAMQVADAFEVFPMLDGKALRFRLEGPGFNPVFVEEFVTNASTAGSGFDGSDRVLVSSERGLRAFGRGGRRLMASDPKRDLSQGEFGNTVHVRRDGDKLFVLDSDRQSLWLFPG